MNSTCSKGGHQGSRKKANSNTNVRSYMTQPSLPTYASIQRELTKEEGAVRSHHCDICDNYHPLKDKCKSKPRFPPSAYFPRCDICYGYHPRYHCYFEKLRHVLFDPSFCEYCNIAHIGFCNDGLLCQICNRKHNFADGCHQQIRTDLSDNLCPRCDGYHSLHCPAGLARIQSNITLWCNRCKIDHNFMNCVPFCNRCFRRHREGICPPSWTYCTTCNYCHQGESCPAREVPTPKEEKAHPSAGAVSSAPTSGRPLPTITSPFEDLEYYLATQ